MVGLLIITHNQVGAALFDAAVSVLGSCPLPAKVIQVSQDCDPDERRARALKAVRELNQGDGVLVVTDMYGSTPSNVATSLCDEQVSVVAGINLPMLVRIMNYPQLSLDQLADKAVSGGRDGVLACFSGGI